MPETTDNITTCGGPCGDVCEAARETVLELGSSREAQRRMATALAHVESCAACRAAMGDYERVAAVLCRDVAATNADEPAGGWLAFEQRLQARVAALGGAATGLAGSNPATSAPRMALHRLNFFRAARAVAACVVVGLLAFYAGRQRPSSRGNPGSDRDVGQLATGAGAGVRPLSPDEVASHLKVFDEVDDLFGHRATYLVLSKGKSEVGLPDGPEQDAPSPRTLATREQMMVFRLTAVRSGETGGGALVSADLVIVPGAAANVAVPLRDGRSTLRCRVTTSDAEQGRLLLRAEVRDVGEPGPTASLATSVRVPTGQPVVAGELITPEGRYELCVSFVPVSKGPGKTMGAPAGTRPDRI